MTSTSRASPPTARSRASKSWPRSSPTRCLPTSAFLATSCWNSPTTLPPSRTPYRASMALAQRRQAHEGAEAEYEARLTPEIWVRGYIQLQRNYLPYLEEAAETHAGPLRGPAEMLARLRRRLHEGRKAG